MDFQEVLITTQIKNPKAITSQTLCFELLEVSILIDHTISCSKLYNIVY